MVLNIVQLYILPFAAAACAIAVGLFVLLRKPGLFAHRAFALCMADLAAESILTGLILQTDSFLTADSLFRWRAVATALIPGMWFVFLAYFAIPDPVASLRRWRWAIAAALAVPLSLPLAFGGMVLSDFPVLAPFSSWAARPGPAGYALLFILLAASVIILMRMERLLRGSTGHFRWQIKFFALGIGCVFGARLYTISQTLLFRFINTELDLVNEAGLIIGSLVMARSFTRMKAMDARFYVSSDMIYNSLTVLAVGVYFIVVGILAQLAFDASDGRSLALKALFILVAIAGLLSLLLSDRLRRRYRRAVSRHFKRPLYDYRIQWAGFTDATTSVLDIDELCEKVVRIVSRTFEALQVNIWIVDDSIQSARLGASTVLSPERREEIREVSSRILKLARALRSLDPPPELDYLEGELPSGLYELGGPAFFESIMTRYCIQLRAGRGLVGLLTLDKIVGRDSRLTFEDFDLLKTMADQAASCILNIRLSEDLRQAKQMEAFQSMSAFLIHDFKNIASKLSLTVQNLPVHFENPEFRQDAVRSISQGVEKINLMCRRLSDLSKGVRLELKPADLNSLVASVASNLNGPLGGKLRQRLSPVPRLFLDEEQFRGVLTNLLLNANEATGTQGEISLETSCSENWAVVAVKDNGRGMTREFIEKSLFHPFKTTKPGGMGIGMYQTKTIVEAHGGRIEVESQEGRGTTFRVLLPIQEKG
jgi:putative PEP-CTERM system histidine kinase